MMPSNQMAYSSDFYKQDEELFVVCLQFIEVKSRSQRGTQGTFILVMQDNGNMHLCHPLQSKLIKEDFVETGCQSARFTVSQAARLNENGVFVVNHDGTEACTYKFCGKDKVDHRESASSLGIQEKSSSDGLSALSDDSSDAPAELHRLDSKWIDNFIDRKLKKNLKAKLGKNMQQKLKNKKHGKREDSDSEKRKKVADEDLDIWYTEQARWGLNLTNFYALHPWRTNLGQN